MTSHLVWLFCAEVFDVSTSIFFTCYTHSLGTVYSIYTARISLTVSLRSRPSASHNTDTLSFLLSILLEFVRIDLKWFRLISNNRFKLVSHTKKGEKQWIRRVEIIIIIIKVGEINAEIFKYLPARITVELG